MQIAFIKVFCITLFLKDDIELGEYILCQSINWELGQSNLADLTNYLSLKWDEYIRKGAKILEQKSFSSSGIKQTKLKKYKAFFDTLKNFNKTPEKAKDLSEKSYDTHLSTTDTFKAKSKPRITNDNEAFNSSKIHENFFKNTNDSTSNQDNSTCGIHAILQRLLKNELFLRQPNKESYKFFKELFF